MNLLPPEHQRELRFEAWRRFMVSFGFYFAVVGIIANLLLLPSYFSLSYQLDARHEQLSLIEKSEEYKNMLTSDAEVGAVNKVLRVVTSFEQDYPVVTPLIEDLLGRAGASTTVTSFSYNRTVDGKKAFEIKGIAATRSLFIAFSESIKQIPYIAAIENPTSNILKEVDTTFTLTIDIKR